MSILEIRRYECLFGNFTFWSWDRVVHEGRLPVLVGAQANLVVIADWMVESEYCAVDLVGGNMVFLGGREPLVSSLLIDEYISLVASDPVTPHGMM